MWGRWVGGDAGREIAVVVGIVQLWRWLGGGGNDALMVRDVGMNDSIGELIVGGARTLILMIPLG